MNEPHVSAGLAIDLGALKAHALTVTGENQVMMRPAHVVALVEIALAAKESDALDNLPVRTTPKYAAFYVAAARLRRALKEIA